MQRILKVTKNVREREEKRDKRESGVVVGSIALTRSDEIW